LDELWTLIDWTRVEASLVDISSSAKGEPAWPPLALFKALLLSVWYDLSDVKLAEALDDRASFRRFCGFSRNEATPERTAFVRFRKAWTVCALDKSLFEEITGQLEAKAIKVKTGTLVDATIITDPPHRSQRVGLWSRNSSGLSASRRLCGSCPGFAPSGRGCSRFSFLLVEGGFDELRDVLSGR
jgi:hypothetical protein